MLKGIRWLILAVNITFVFSAPRLQPEPSSNSSFWSKIIRPRKLNKAAFLSVMKNSPSSLSSSIGQGVVGESVFQKLQMHYAEFQQTFYSESRELSGGLLEGLNEVNSNCGSCKGTALGKQRTQCYASCITRELDSFTPYALLIGDAVQNLFCIPLGFGFESHFVDQALPNFPPWFWSFPKFVSDFNANNDSFSESSLVETYLSNLLWLDKSPLYLHSYIKSQVALDIASAQSGLKPSNAAFIIPSDNAVDSPAQFASKCGSQWDLLQPVYSLINAARQKSSFLDVILRGLFTVRGAAFYTIGQHQNLAGGILEALNTFIGTKCDVISYAEGEDVSEHTCDGLGKFPIPQFPVPLIFSRFILPCD